MNNIITELSRPVRRRLKKVVQFNTDGNYRRRAEAILLLNEGYSRKQVSQLLSASRTSIRKWVQHFEQFGESALVPESRGEHPIVSMKQFVPSYWNLFRKIRKNLGGLAQD
ncbi:MAG TPA: helix-turn-helix domain-containing protein [Gammaproteobacteria bacterium]|nr:helix-turn-helix domain-containing protein [Gammaproteobacteria bacterium]